MELLDKIFKNGLCFLDKYHNDKAFNALVYEKINTSFKWKKDTKSKIFMPKKLDLDELLKDAFKKSALARKAILNTKNPNIYTKDDGSKVTDADFNSNKELLRLKHFAVVSEENISLYFKNDKLDLPDIFWLIDPLDGTSGYIKDRDNFCICVALVYKKRPILGLIYDVMKDLCVYASISSPLFVYQSKSIKTFENKFLKPLYKHPKTDTLNEKIFLISSRKSNSSEYFINKGLKYESQGSAIKFIRLALSKNHAFFRNESLSFWDLCAGEFLVFASGGAMFCDNGYMIYDKIKMPNFCAFDKSWVD